MTPPTSNLAAVILAAGWGERLKELGAKPLLQCHHKAFVEIITDHALQSRAEPIYLVTNAQIYPRMVRLNLPVTFFINPRPAEGMLSSIKLALDSLPEACAGLLMCPVDFPLVTLETYQQLTAAFKSASDSIIQPVYLSQRGHPVIFPKFLFNELKQAPLNEGARYVSRKFSHLIRTVPVHDPGVLLNINTREMYEKYCQ